MSALKFNSFCGACFATIGQGSGLILSCGDFLCNSCSYCIEDGCCPVCCTSGVRSAKLSNPPGEVSQNMNDVGQQIQSIFLVLNFQLTHYKETLARASQRIVNMAKTEREYKRYY